jgi:hypothetical protein
MCNAFPLSPPQLINQLNGEARSGFAANLLALANLWIVTKAYAYC